MRYLSLAVLAASSLASSLALAQSNNMITFEGEVLDESCQALINGSADAVVKLEPVKVGDFGSNNTAGLTSFTMEITDCEHVDNKKLTVKFIATNPVNGNLNNIAPADKAKGVSVQLTNNKDGTEKIDLQNGVAVLEINEKFSTDGSGKHEFGVQYHKDSDITPGKVKAMVEYRLSYL